MLCCVCLLENSNIMDIFDDIGERLNVAEIINEHFWFKPQPNDLQTSQICTICWNKIDDFHNFYKTVEKAHHDFQQIQQNKVTVKEEDRICFSAIKKEKFEDEKILENLLQLEVEIVENLKKNNQTGENSIEVKNPLLNEQNDESDVVNDETDSSDLFSDEDVVLANLKKKPVSQKKTKRKTKKTKECTKKKYKSKHGPELSEEIIKKHIQMVCYVCHIKSDTFADLKIHFKDHHPDMKPYITCCDKQFDRNCNIVQHAARHENPDCYRCNECNKSFTAPKGLRTHIIEFHGPEGEKLHTCDFCPRKFQRKNLLELHRKSHIPQEEWNFICSKCTTRTAKFASQYLLNIHTSMYHRKEVNVCHVCAKEIKDKKAFEKHVRYHFEDSGPRLKCPLPDCNRWLKDEDNLKTHMQLHNLSGKAYVCSECNKECPNRRALAAHKRFVHSKEIFKCEVCDKTFKKALGLKEHMAQHTGESLYKCPFCPRTFNSNANMHSHKKKQHPIEWEELRRQKLGPLAE